ncbi:Metallo-hydrolase/oxidoreductase [Pholiota conissans]|uniref:Metallo-hydrolase/oxidoreductase n=1 Tax=Pholiota conissans TaxID=109636 RepID=A0A9P5YVV9_9AGAR|nr:Metallo-hydrolase/oxidoreductase [Pholiota conissans]
MRSILESLLWGAGGAFAVLAYLLYSSSQSTDNVIVKPPKAAFHASRLTPSTFLIKEYDDIYSEHPHIYAKVVHAANTILVIDTGCGGASNDTEITITSLKEFIDNVGVDDNNGHPLNEGGKIGYVVALTHCHYDHILGVEDFSSKSWPILASGHSPSFVSKEQLPESSLCKPMGIEMPIYTPTLVADRHRITAPGFSKELGVTILHTPGHTPDEIALFDEAEMMLYVGDSLYEHEHIIFPSQGSITTWFASMKFLVSFVKEKNELSVHSSDSAMAREVLINSGHVTALRPALDVLLGAIAFVRDVVDGKEKVKERRWHRGEATVTYEQGDNRFSLRCPERLVLEARGLKEV